MYAVFTMSSSEGLVHTLRESRCEAMDCFIVRSGSCFRSPPEIDQGCNYQRRISCLLSLLASDTINEQLVSAANVEEGHLVLEIGPGTGSLTNVLVNAGADVLAVEKDLYMAGLVSERFANSGRVKSRPEELTLDDFVRLHNLIEKA